MAMNRHGGPGFSAPSAKSLLRMCGRCEHRRSRPFSDGEPMPGLIRNILEAVRARRIAWRRARNLTAGPRRSRPRPTAAVAPIAAPAARRIAAAGVLAALAGAMLIASHARSLGLALDGAGAGAGALPAVRFAAVLPPGAGFSVPGQGGITLAGIEGGALLIAAGAHSAPPVKIDLCSQMQGRRLLPVRIGYGFDDVARWVARGRAAPHNVALGGPGADDMPRVEVSGDVANGDNGGAGAAAPAPLQLRWDSGDPAVRWIGDAAAGKVEGGAHGQVALGRDGWLVWRPDAALHIQRRASAACPQAGELVVRVVRSMPGKSAAKAQVTAYPAGGQPVGTWLGAGRYQVPLGAGRGLEDQALFEELRRRGMVRLGAGGLAELAPRDLPAWRAAPVPGRAGQLAGWDGVTLDAGAVKLLKRLYRLADGDYVREQVRVFNGEQRLLAWRAPQQSQLQTRQKMELKTQWQASVGGAAPSTTSAMPAAAARLFAAVGHGWAP
ncbi:MAG: hypothetical protein JWR65_377, partial [Massilia sp.]|nr:hypothetical protein [Massilia sp.]